MFLTTHVTVSCHAELKTTCLAGGETSRGWNVQGANWQRGETSINPTITARENRSAQLSEFNRPIKNIWRLQNQQTPECFAPSTVRPWMYSSFPAYSIKAQAPGGKTSWSETTSKRPDEESKRP